MKRAPLWLLLPAALLAAASAGAQQTDTTVRPRWTYDGIAARIMALQSGLDGVIGTGGSGSACRSGAATGRAFLEFLDSLAEADVAKVV